MTQFLKMLSPSLHFMKLMLKLQHLLLKLLSSTLSPSTS
jgi:hypothetical protein